MTTTFFRGLPLALAPRGHKLRHFREVAALEQFTEEEVGEIRTRWLAADATREARAMARWNNRARVSTPAERLTARRQKAAAAVEFARAETRRAAVDAAERAECAALAAMPLPIRADARMRILGSAHCVESARFEAEHAVLETLARLARTRWGFVIRHRSGKGRLDSTYMRTPFGEVRVSDHELPLYGEREERHLDGCGPRWDGEIVLNGRNVLHGATWWRRAILLASDGRPIPCRRRRRPSKETANLIIKRAVR